MNIGVCTTDFRSMPMDELFLKIHSMGFKSIQFNFSSITEAGFQSNGVHEIPENISAGLVARIKSSAEWHKLKIACVNGTFNMAHPDVAVREEGVKRFAGFARAVKAMGCEYISLCTGTRERSYLWQAHPDNQTEQAYQDMMQVMRALVAIAEAENVVLLVETEASNVIDTPQKARRMLDEIGSPRLKMIMDCANLFHVGDASEANVGRIMKHAFDVYGKDVRLAHGKDIKAGPGIEFCGCGQGIVDFDYMMALLYVAGYRGDMVLHGIKNEAKMMPARAFMQDKVMRSPL